MRHVVQAFDVIRLVITFQLYCEFIRRVSFDVSIEETLLNYHCETNLLSPWFVSSSLLEWS